VVGGACWVVIEFRSKLKSEQKLKRTGAIRQRSNVRDTTLLVLSWVFVILACRK
jgi:hypothetical protein